MRENSSHDSWCQWSRCAAVGVGHSVRMNRATPRHTCGLTCLPYVSDMVAPPSGRPPEAGHGDGDRTLTPAPSMSAATWDSCGTGPPPPPLGYLPRPAGVSHPPRFFLWAGKVACGGTMQSSNGTERDCGTATDARRPSTARRPATRHGHQPPHDPRRSFAGTLHPGTRGARFGVPCRLPQGGDVDITLSPVAGQRRR